MLRLYIIFVLSEIDNLGETIKDTNRSMIQNLHEVVREVVSRDSNKTRDTARDNDSEIREIQKTLLDMQVGVMVRSVQTDNAAANIHKQVALLRSLIKQYLS